MDYLKCYNSIIIKRKELGLVGIGEFHHIIPRSLGGTDDPSNIVKLTLREHFICHALLTKIYEKESFEWYKMIHAFLMMKASATGSRYYNSRIYEHARKYFPDLMSKLQTGKNNSQYSTMWIYNLELKQSKKIGKGEVIPENWKIGRVINFEEFINSIEQSIKRKEELIQSKNIKKLKLEQYMIDKSNQKREVELQFINLYKRYCIGGYKSLRDFHKSENINYSIMTLSKRWRQLIPEYSSKG